MKNLRKRILSTALIVFVFLLPFALFNLLYNRMFIPPELVPTAEALLKSPTSPPTWITLHPPAGSTLHAGDSIEIDLLICTGPINMSSCKSPLRQEDDSFQGIYKYRDWSIISINGGRYHGFLGGDAVGTMIGGTLTLPSYPVLLPGNHVFKIQAAGSQVEQNNPDPKLSYEWVYRME